MPAQRNSLIHRTVNVTFIGFPNPPLWVNENLLNVYQGRRNFYLGGLRACALVSWLMTNREMLCKGVIFENPCKYLVCSTDEKLCVWQILKLCFQENVSRIFSLGNSYDVKGFLISFFKEQKGLFWALDVAGAPFLCPLSVSFSFPIALWHLVGNCASSLDAVCGGRGLTWWSDSFSPGTWNWPKGIPILNLICIQSD